MPNDRDDTSLSEVTNNEAAGQYELRAGGQVASLRYGREAHPVLLVHTDVPSALEGQGVGSAIVRHALEDARVRGLAVVPVCPFVQSYLRRHPEYVPLVHEDYRGRFE